MATEIPLSTYKADAPGGLYQFLSGLRFFLAGWRVLLRNPPLLALSLVPVLLTIVLLSSLAFGSVWAIGNLLGEPADELSAGLKFMMQVIVLFAALFIGVVLYLPLTRVILAPFTESLARRTHATVYATPLPLSEMHWMRAMWEGLKLVSLQIVLALFIVLISIFVPVIGPIIGFLAGTVFCAMDFLDIPLSARGLPMRRKFRCLWDNKAVALGFGTVGYLMLLIPLINLLALPAGIIGATILCERLRASH